MLESKLDVIREEVLALRNGPGFQPYRGPRTGDADDKDDKTKGDEYGSFSHDKGTCAPPLLLSLTLLETLCRLPFPSTLFAA